MGSVDMHICGHTQTYTEMGTSHLAIEGLLKTRRLSICGSCECKPTPEKVFVMIFQNVSNVDVANVTAVRLLAKVKGVAILTENCLHSGI